MLALHKQIYTIVNKFCGCSQNRLTPHKNNKIKSDGHKKRWWRRSWPPLLLSLFISFFLKRAYSEHQHIYKRISRQRIHCSFCESHNKSRAYEIKKIIPKQNHIKKLFNSFSYQRRKRSQMILFDKSILADIYGMSGHHFKWNENI